MAVDVHPKHPHMLAVALSDGNIAIYNLQKVNEKPAYISTARNGKHQDIAWQVKCNLINTSNYYKMRLYFFCNFEVVQSYNDILFVGKMGKR